MAIIAAFPFAALNRFLQEANHFYHDANQIQQDNNNNNDNNNIDDNNNDLPEDDEDANQENPYILRVGGPFQVNILDRLSEYTNNADDELDKSLREHVYLSNCKSYYSCIHCLSHVANHDHLISRTFQGSHGRANLFEKVINIRCGAPRLRQLITGQHVVCDIFCSRCDYRLGWKYQKAFQDSQKYKEGKYVVELAYVIRQNRQLQLDENEHYFGKSQLASLVDQDNTVDIDRLSVSSRQYDRRRRSLYLESKPYDWKQQGSIEVVKDKVVPSKLDEVSAETLSLKDHLLSSLKCLGLSGQVIR